ncbi:hypothetical protein AB0G02_39345, partial [Actinosynnema sp. NPDC023658]|uniref:hypothetical protein n=1 Tax=Actinosynnema sp. NPDC023658 TaxID=3155465 RepID=UPI0033C012C1
RTPVRGTPLADLLAARTSRERRGTPDVAVLAGPARALDVVRGDRFREEVWRTSQGATELAAEFTLLGHRVVTGGTDNHVVFVALPADVAPHAVDALREVNLVVDRVPGPDPVIALDVTSAGRRGFDRSEMRHVAQLADEALKGVRTGDRLDRFTRLSVRDEVLRLLWQFPLPRHVPTTRWRTNP